jgi:hypothetical protein
MDERFQDWLIAHEQDNFDQVPMISLGSICQRLGQSGRGTREELVTRIREQLNKQRH